MLSTLDPSCDLIEAGREPVYEKKAISRMLDSRVIPGNIVNRWDMTSLYGTNETGFFEWIFDCTYETSPGHPLQIVVLTVTERNLPDFSLSNLQSTGPTGFSHPRKSSDI
jgi:hypothetical protein